MMSDIDLLKENIVELFENGLNFNQISKKLDISPQAVKVNVPSDLLLKRVDNLLSQGFYITEISQKLGVSHAVISKITKRSLIFQNMIQKIIHDFKNGSSIKTLSKDFNMGNQQIISHIPESVRKERLVQLYIIEKLQYNEITEILGISRSGLKKWLHKFDLMNRHPNAGKYLKEFPKEEIIRDYMKLKSMETIQKERGVAKSTIQKIFSENKLKTYSNLYQLRRRVNGEPDVSITEPVGDIIIGEMLGDFHIDCNVNSEHSITRRSYQEACDKLRQIQTTNNYILSPVEFNKTGDHILAYPMARLVLTASILEAPWVYFLKQIFEKYNISMTVTPNIGKTKKYFDISLTSKRLMEINDIHKEWYQDEMKIVPKSIKITPNNLLHWFIGDGSFADGTVTLATNSFSDKDVKFLVQILNNTIHISSRLYNSKDGPEIKIYKKLSVKWFFEFIDLADSNSLDYAKKIFPWKFDSDLRKRDVMKSNQYQDLLYKELLTNNISLYPIIIDTIERFYGK